MGKYSLFKERLLQTNLSLVGIGTSLAWAFAGEDCAINFAYGGVGGLLYQWLLQKGVDGMSVNTSPLYQKVGPFHLAALLQTLRCTTLSKAVISQVL